MKIKIFFKIAKRLAEINHFVQEKLLVNTIASSKLTPNKIRYLMYKIYGIKTDTDNIYFGCFFGGNNVKIGQGTFINCQCFFDNNEAIEIGDNCAIAMEVMFITSTHEIGRDDTLSRSGKPKSLPVKVGNRCWIGARATVLPGVTIGEGCVIASGAVVTKDCLPNGLYAGVPAQRIKELP